MPVSFGFSVGDFLSAIELVETVIDALSSTDSSVEFRELISQLRSLETALLQVKRLELDESQYAEVVALRQAAGMCQRTVAGFWRKIVRDQPSLAAETSNFGTRDSWMKINWAICKREDVARFKADLVAHRESIQLLLTTVQMSQTKLTTKYKSERKSLIGYIQEVHFNFMKWLGFVALADQGKQLLGLTSSVIRTNLEVFRIVLQLQNFIRHIPTSVERQQPVYMIDALGRQTPFHLEFVRSAEAFIAILSINHRKHGHNIEKRIENREFIIQDSTTKKFVDLNAEWEQCFRPGQRVEMSLILDQPDEFRLYENCPNCKTERAPSVVKVPESQDLSISCSHCGIRYRTVLDLGYDSGYGSGIETPGLESFNLDVKKLKNNLEGLRQPLSNEMEYEIPEGSVIASDMRSSSSWGGGGNTVAVKWKCTCGLSFQEKVVEFRPGAAQQLAGGLEQVSTVDIERLAGSDHVAMSSSSGGESSRSISTISTRRSYQRQDDQPIGRPGEDEVIEEQSDPDNPEYILLCKQNGRDARLHHADITQAPCDNSTYNVLHRIYYGRYPNIWRWITLREIYSIDFVKFHLYWATNVSIDSKDIGLLPPQPSPDYDYRADTNPPVLTTALRHFIEHPTHAPKTPAHRPRIPKKVKQPLELLEKNMDPREGYGLYVRDQIAWVRVCVVESVFATFCLLFAVVWCTRNNGGIQDGFAIAGTGLAYATIILGALQALCQRKG